MSGKTAIIVPIYNQEKLLARTLDSIRNQTCGDWTAYCVNDGSTDSSGAILASYAARDGRFEVLTQANGGEGKARNTGLAAALANPEISSVVFLDSDDCLHPRCLELARYVGAAAPSAIVEWEVCSGDGSDLAEFGALPYEISSVPCVDGRRSLTVWNKLYPADLLRRVRFCEGAKIAADIAFVLEVIHRENPAFRHIGAELHYYLVNPNSISHRAWTAVEYANITRIIEYMVGIYDGCPEALQAFCSDQLPSLLKRFWRELRHVADADRLACRREFGQELASLHRRGLLRPKRGCLKDLKYYLRFRWMACRYGREAP